jgi:hypothetical protein
MSDSMVLFAEILMTLLAFRVVARLMLGEFPIIDGALLIFFMLFLSII